MKDNMFGKAYYSRKSRGLNTITFKSSEDGKYYTSSWEDKIKRGKCDLDQYNNRYTFKKDSYNLIRNQVKSWNERKHLSYKSYGQYTWDGHYESSGRWGSEGLKYQLDRETIVKSLRNELDITYDLIIQEIQDKKDFNDIEVGYIKKEITKMKNLLNKIRENNGCIKSFDRKERFSSGWRR